MNMVYDLLLDFEDEVYEFFEWERDEEIEHIKKIPLFYVSHEMILELFQNKIMVSCDFLEKIYMVTEKYNMDTIDYACLFTDGSIVIGVEFDSDGKSICYSRLQLIDEEEITKYLKKEDKKDISYKILGENKDKNLCTKNEKKIKKFLEREILASYETCEFSKLKYLYLEYFGVDENNFLKIRDELLDSISGCLTKKHFELYEMLRLSIDKKVS